MRGFRVTVTGAARAVTSTELLAGDLGHPPVITLPGNAVGAGRALTVGENEFPPDVTPFSVGDGVAVEFEDGGVSTAGFSFVEHAVKNPRPISAAALAATALRRTEVDDVMMENLPGARAGDRDRAWCGPEPGPAPA
jgi:hypothetical protein